MLKLAANGRNFFVREGTIDDIPLLLSFIRKMADFEKLDVQASQESLQESLFGKHPAAHVLLAFVDDQPAAYVVYFFTFATMVGRRGLWLDDLYVEPEFRQMGIASALMGHLGEIAILHNCARFEWMVLDWNQNAIGLYERLGAKMLGNWRICRLEEDKIVLLSK